MNIFYFFIFDDKPETAEEFDFLITEIYGRTIELNGRIYQIRVIQAHTFEECKAVMSNPEYLQQGGMILLDLAFDDNNPQNKESFSLRMIRELKVELKREVLPYGIVMMTAFDREVYRIILEEDDAIRNEKLGQIYKRTEDGDTAESQLKENVRRFEAQYVDTGGGKWQRNSPAQTAWLRKYELEIRIGMFSEQRSNYLKQLFGVPEIIRPDKNYWMPNEIFAIERVADGDSFYIIYPSAPGSLPLLARHIKIKDQDFEEETWKYYNPSTEDKFTALQEHFNREALPFLRIHEHFMISMIYLEEIVTKGQRTNVPVQVYANFQWASMKPKEIYPSRGRFALLRRDDHRMYFPIGGGYDPKRNIFTYRWQQEIAAECVKQHEAWYQQLK
ncbi:MAG: hypothetical protein SFV55_01505 [Haliscomenobacter sp.]|uniref:hypothetical protein n=1 Tax=Haliscomenobacter sp. TaxID=2717303 RepID=UPI0029A9698F|nr:hypothetical protein [Haliscomenobacter sp.]MDX2067066.1 hypothetical protein [Haliscomenobacter sp.]